MIDVPSSHDIAKALTGIIVLIFLWGLIRVMNNASNALTWADLLSVRGTDGAQHASWDPIGKGCGVVLCVFCPVVYTYSPKMDAIGLAAILGVALAYLGGVAGYSAYLRSKMGSVTTVTEPVPDPTTTKTTVVESPPVAKRKGK